MKKNDVQSQMGGSSDDGLQAAFMEAFGGGSDGEGVSGVSGSDGLDGSAGGGVEGDDGGAPDKDEDKGVNPRDAGDGESEGEGEGDDGEEGDAGQQGGGNDGDGSIVIDMGAGDAGGSGGGSGGGSSVSDTRDETIAGLRKEIEDLKRRSVFANAAVEKLNEHVLRGGKIDSVFWDMQTKDYGSIDEKALRDDKTALGLYRDSLRYVEGLDDKMVERQLRKEFPILSGHLGEDEYDPEDLEDERLLLFRSSRSGLEKLREKSEAMRLPDVSADRKLEISRAMDAYRSESRVALRNYEGLSLHLSDGVEVKIKPGVDTMNAVRSIVVNPEEQGDAFFKKRYLKDGKVDYVKFASEMQILSDFQAISRAIFEQGMARGKASIKKVLKQTPDTTPGGSSHDPDWRDDFAGSLGKASAPTM